MPDGVSARALLHIQPCYPIAISAASVLAPPDYIFGFACRLLFERLPSHALQCITDVRCLYDLLSLSLGQRLL
jgi:hypothetical protein